MERLQEAIEKARAQRDGGPKARPQSSRTKAVSAKVQATWDALPSIELRNRALRRNRILSIDGGLDAAPYDLLRTRILQQARQNDWHRVAFVSPHVGCGKTTTAANLAFSLSRQPEIRSMIFDFDLRRRGLTRMLRQTPAHGMADVLRDRVTLAELARRYGKNVAFGLNNATVGTASEILQSAQTGEVLDEIQATYQPDLMLFDMPPMMSSDDNYGFLQNVDCAIVMAKAEKTSMSQIDVTERQVAELTNVMGIVLNSCRYMDGVYGHDYAYY